MADKVVAQPMLVRVAKAHRYGLRRFEPIWGLFFLAPMLILTAVFVIYPIFGSIRISLYNWIGIGNPTQYVGLRHFQTVANDPLFWNAFKNTVIYTVVLVPIQLSLALVLAVILNDQKLRFRLFYRTIYFLPVVTSVAIVAVVLRLMLGNFGSVISQVLGIDPPISPIGSAQLSLLTVIGFGIWQTFGFNLVYFLAALQTVPQELYDAAKVDGANSRQRLIHVTLPMIRPVSTIILFLAVLGSLHVFEQSFILTGGGPYYSSEVVSSYIYGYAFGSLDYPTVNLGYASAAAFFFSILVLIITAAQWIITNKARQKE